MSKEKIRSLENLPLEVKLAYAKILAMMLVADRELDQLKLAAFYRLMARIQISAVARREVLEAVCKGQSVLEDLANQCCEGLNLQEKNILRFSLYKDLLIIMRANYLENSKEERLLDMISELFDVNEAHKNFFEEELKRDASYFETDKDIKLVNEAIVEAAAGASAIGFPLGIIRCYSCTGGLGAIGMLSGLHRLGKKITKKHPLLTGAAIAASVGVLSYCSAKYLLKYKDRYSGRLKDLMAKKMHEQQQLAISYLESDIEYFHTKAQLWEDARNNQAGIALHVILNALKKAKVLLENTKPAVV